MDTRSLSEPEWINNPRFLQEKIYGIIARIINPNDVNALLDEEALSKYWVRAFTHKSVEPDPRKNYETLEFYGDKVMNDVFSDYIRKRFDDRIDQANGTLLMNKYMSKDFQANLAEKLGLTELIRFDPGAPNVNINVKEDVLESFFGCLKILADDRIQQGFGYVYCFNLINWLFNDIPIILEEIQKDPVTLLKERYEKLAWGAPQYTTKNSDNPQLGEKKVEIRNQLGELLGVGYGAKAKASASAAQNALNNLDQNGYTLEYAEKNKDDRLRARNADFDKQYRRVQAAIVELNKVAQSRNKVLINDFKVASVTSHGHRHTFSLEVAYKGADGKYTWKSIKSLIGDDQDRTKIQLMKEFADLYKIPEVID